MAGSGRWPPRQSPLSIQKAQSHSEIAAAASFSLFVRVSVAHNLHTRRSFEAPTIVAATPQYHKYLEEENRFHSSTRHSDSRTGGGRVPPPRNRNLDYPTYNFTGARSHNYSTFDLLKTPIKESRFRRPHLLASLNRSALV